MIGWNFTFHNQSKCRKPNHNGSGVCGQGIRTGLVKMRLLILKLLHCYFFVLQVIVKHRPTSDDLLSADVAGGNGALMASTIGDVSYDVIYHQNVETTNRLVPRCWDSHQSWSLVLGHQLVQSPVSILDWWNKTKTAVCSQGDLSVGTGYWSVQQKLDT